MEEKIVFLLFAPHKNITFYYVNVFYNVNVNSLFLNGEGQVYIEKTNEFSIIRCYWYGLHTQEITLWIQESS